MSLGVKNKTILILLIIALSINYVSAVTIIGDNITTEKKVAIDGLIIEKVDATLYPTENFIWSPQTRILPTPFNAMGLLSLDYHGNTIVGSSVNPFVRSTDSGITIDDNDTGGNTFALTNYNSNGLTMGTNTKTAYSAPDGWHSWTNSYQGRDYYFWGASNDSYDGGILHEFGFYNYPGLGYVLDMENHPIINTNFTNSTYDTITNIVYGNQSLWSSIGRDGADGINGTNGTNGINGTNATFNASLDYPNYTVPILQSFVNNTFLPILTYNGDFPNSTLDSLQQNYNTTNSFINETFLPINTYSGNFPNLTVENNSENWNSTYNSSYLTIAYYNGDYPNSTFQSLINSTQIYVNDTFLPISTYSGNFPNLTVENNTNNWNNTFNSTYDLQQSYVNNTFLPISTYSGDFPNSTISNNEANWNSTYNSSYLTIAYYDGNYPNTTFQALINNTETYVNNTFLPITTYSGDFPNSTVFNNSENWNNTYNASYLRIDTYNGDFPNSSLINYLLINTYNGDFPNSTITNNTNNWNNTYNISYNTLLTNAPNTTFQTLITALQNNDTAISLYINNTFVNITSYNGDFPNSTVANNTFNWNNTYNASYDNLATRYYYPTSVSNTNGTVLDATLTVANISFLDNNFATINETATTPAFTVNVNFTNVSTFNKVIVYYCYCIGSSNHEIDIDLYNFSSSSWITLSSDLGSSFSNVVIRKGYTFTIANPSDFISTGVVLGRISHVTIGSLPHSVTINQFILGT